MPTPDIVLIDDSLSSSRVSELTPSEDDFLDEPSKLSHMNDYDPVCIVGIGCRLPGDIRSPSALWDFMVNKKSAQGPVPPDRFNIHGFHDPDSTLRGTLSAGGGYFLDEDVRQFDNSMFGINNLETTYMDPKQRKLLEVVYECFESAGVSMDDISGTNTGVYVGNFTVDYQTMQMRDPDYLHRYSATGLGTAILANRISHVFNLHGPSVTLDTACSSTLYCFHSAARAIEAGDCAGAIVAGANLITSPEQHLGTAMAGILSSSSTCNTFDASANGYGRAEGVNAIYMKRLSSALAAGDKVWAIVRSSAVNSNGRTPGITQPSSSLQEEVIRKAYAQAGLSFADTDYIECHGTGTSVGDPIEVDGIARCFSAEQRATKLHLGAVKTNLGHSEAASGLTSIIKVCLAFEKGRLPPTYGPRKINPNLHLEERGMKVVTETLQWPRRLRRAGINSFGYGGANAHIILEAPESYDDDLFHSSTSQNGITNPVQQLVIPMSAGSRKSLQQQKVHISEHIRHSTADRLRSLVFTISKCRSNLAFKDFLITGADENGNHTSIDTKVSENDASDGTSRLPFAFVFTGQGAQYPGMGKELLQHNPTFRAIIKHLDAILQALPPEYAPTWTLEQSILDPEGQSNINEAARSQPVCTAVQLALVSVLRSWGVEANAVIGHSSGEIGAAYAAGLLTETQAIVSAYFRGYVVSQIRGRGAMLATALNDEDANKLIQEEGLSTLVSVACINSPQSVTLSGSVEGIDTLITRLQEKKIFARKLHTGGLAYHSSMMKEVGNLYKDLLAPYFPRDIRRQTEIISMFSSVRLSEESRPDMNFEVDMPQYWRDNLELPVQFDSATKRLLASGKYHLVEIGPHSTLKGPLKQIQSHLGKPLLPYSPTLIRNQDADLSMKLLAGALYVHGHKLNWCTVNGLPERGIELLSDLPPYPWDYSGGLLWHETRPSVELRERKHKRHELLGSQQVAGNAIDWAWRNILHMDEVPWLMDHKVESQVVFPAAGYLTMVLEALSQIREEGTVAEEERSNRMVCEFSNVNIRSALVVPEKVGLESESLELHTTMTAKQLSTASVSNTWYEFSISSWRAGHATVHCAGSVRLVPSTSAFSETVTTEGLDNLELQPMSRWYDKMREEGLSFGTYFQSLATARTDGNRQRTLVVCDTKLDPVERHDRYRTRCARQVIAIDACLQASIVSDSAGNLGRQRAWLPMFIPFCQCSLLDASRDTSSAIVHAQSTRAGVSTLNADSTLYDGRGIPLVDLKNVRLSLYSGKVAAEPVEQMADQQRQPCLRIQWKPDLYRLRADLGDNLVASIKKTAEDISSDLSVGDESLRLLRAVIDLAAHKSPQLRVLELGDGTSSEIRNCIDRLSKDTGFARYKSWHKASVDEEGNLRLGNGTSGLYDLIISAEDTVSQVNGGLVLETVKPHLKDSGVAVMRSNNASSASLVASGFEAIQLDKQYTLAIPLHNTSWLEGKDVMIVYLRPSKAVQDLILRLSGYFQQLPGIRDVLCLPFSEVVECPPSEETVCISLIEIEHDLLSEMDDIEMYIFRCITNSVTDLLWVTGSSAPDAESPRPNASLVSGLSRALMLEQPSLRFSVLTLCPEANSLNSEGTCNNILSALTSLSETDDKEFVEINGMLHISRFAPESEINRLFCRRLGLGITGGAATEDQGIANNDKIQETTVAQAEPVRLAIGTVGVTKTLHFQQLREPSMATPPPAGYIDVRLMAVSLNAKDVYAVNGRVDTRNGTTALEFAGVVTAVGEDANTDTDTDADTDTDTDAKRTNKNNKFSVGDRVVVLAPNHFTTTERVPTWSAHKLLPGEAYGTMATLPVAYATALYALQHRARLQPGETVLIHCGSGAFGAAAILIAKNLLGARAVYTTASSALKQSYIANELGIPREHIFQSRDDSFVKGIMKATKGKGVDVVVNSLVGDLMHETWKCVANFGRFVEVGKRELIDAGRLDMSVFERNASFTAFDLSELYWHEDEAFHDILHGAVAEVLQMYRNGKIRPGPITTFDISETDKAYRYFSSKDRVGKVVISMENPNSPIPVAPAKYLTIFDPTKAYLLVGCLGGLGRSLSRWMLARGARHFVFLGRSGSDKPSAQQLIARLRSAGATATVVRGDVSVAEDVDAAVAACAPRQIGGVIQAAMGLHESLFSTMTSEAWHTAVRPKLVGTWNLHNALGAQGHDNEALDFFLLTSSVSGSVGTATESNYCAANAFLDAFAKWRRAQGKTAVSVGLGMIADVGYLHENPDIEKLLLRRGVQPLSEDEFLQVIDLALTAVVPNGDDKLELESAHLLTGLEPFKVRELLAKGFDVSHGTIQDPRASIIAAAFKSTRESGDGGDELTMRDVDRAASAPWVRGLPANAVLALATEGNVHSLHDAVLHLTRKQFSNLILIAPDQIDNSKSLLAFGVDSMIAAEFRMWFWTTFKVDVSFLDILSSNQSLNSLSEFVAEKLVDQSVEQVADGK